MADNFATRVETWDVRNYLIVPLNGVAYQILARAYPRYTIPPILRLPPTALQDLNFTPRPSQLFVGSS